MNWFANHKLHGLFRGLGPFTHHDAHECGINENRLIIIEISCRAIHKLVSEYVDGELDPELRSRVETHLRVCRHCTAIVEGTVNVVRLVLDGLVLELPRKFGEHLLERLRAADPPTH